MNTENKKPKITVVTVNLNGEKYLERAILSVLTQNYPNLEYIIIDGGSTDNSLEIIKKYSHRVSYWISEPDTGMYDALQKGFNQSTGEIMCWLNSDDEFYPHTFSTLAEIFTIFPQIKWLEGANSFINENDTIYYTSPARKLSKYDFYSGDYEWIQQESTFWRRELWNKTNGLQISLKYAGDFALWLSFFAHENLWTTDIVLGKFRQTKNQLSKLFIDKYHEEAKKILKALDISDKKEINILKKVIKKRNIIKIIKSLKIINAQAFENFFYKKLNKEISFNKPAVNFNETTMTYTIKN